jgi:NAD(P)-dependent dehydrogenase (short-subunit alcohol dehydrogenase family)
MTMYATCAVAPPFLASKLVAGNNFAPGAKFLLVTTEGGSLSLRTSDEGGGNFAHHGSKAAENMVGRLLSLDLGPKGVTVVNIHVSGARARAMVGRESRA